MNGNFVKPSQVAFLSARIPSQRPAPVEDSTLEQTLRLTIPTPHITAPRLQSSPKLGISPGPLTAAQLYHEKKKDRKKHYPSII